MTFEETQIDWNEHQFTLREACYLSGVADDDLRNWLKRGILDMGKRHKLGRWLFSGIDVIQLRIINELKLGAGIDVSTALRQLPLFTVRLLAILNGQGQQTNADGSPQTLEYVWLERGFKTAAGDRAPMLVPVWWNGSDGEMPDVMRHPDAKWSRRPHIIVPIDAIILDAKADVIAHLRAEHFEEKDSDA